MAEVNSVGVTDDQPDENASAETTSPPNPADGSTQGALSKVGSITDKQSQAESARSQMADLRSQYADAAGQTSKAYAQQVQTLKDARDRLLGMNLAPSPREQAFRIAAAMGTGDNTGRPSMVPFSEATAENLKAQREAELQKNNLLSAYGMQTSNAQIGQGNTRMSQLSQLIREAGSDLRSANSQADKAPPVRDKYFSQDPNDPTKWVDNPAARDADNQQKAQQAKDSANARLAAKASLMGTVTPEAIEYTQRTGQVPTGYSRDQFMVKQLWDGVHAKNIAEGNNVNDWFAQTQSTKAMAGLIKDYESGKTSTTLDGLNTSVKHTQVLLSKVDDLNNTDVSVVNRAANFLSDQLGAKAPRNFDTARDFVSGEIAKAVLPGGGGEMERDRLAAAAKNSDGPGKLKSVIQEWYTLLAGKTDALRNRWQVGTNGTQGDFNKWLLPETQAALGYNKAAPPQNHPGQTPVAPGLTPAQQALLNRYPAAH